LGSLLIMKNAEVLGNLHVKGKILDDDVITSKKNSEFAGTLVGIGSIGSRLEAPAGKGFALYTKPKGGKADPKKPRLFITDAGGVGIGTMRPMAKLHLKTEPKRNALRIQTGGVSIGGNSRVLVDGEAKGKGLPGQRLAILANGNIGVNTPKPTEKFHISGAAKIDSGASFGPSKATLYLTNTLSKCDEHTLRVRNHFYVSACGRVGVKTPKPLAEFHVTGTTKTTNLAVDKDVNVKGTTTINVLTPLKGLLAAKKLRIEAETQLKGKTQIDDDLVVKGNLFVMKEVKMIGGGGSSELSSEMLMDRISLIEESHRTLQDHNKKMHTRVAELEAQLAKRR